LHKVPWRRERSAAWLLAAEGKPPETPEQLSLESAADIQRASLSRRADGLFTCQACAYGCVACVKSERVLSSKMRMDACVKFEDSVRSEKHDGVPAICFTLTAYFISKEIETHDGMPANFLERKT